MIRQRTSDLRRATSLRLILCLIVFCTGATQILESPGTLLHAGENEKRPTVPPNPDDSRPDSALSDEEVLRLQAEKQDSIDRLEQTASEIARLWKEKLARKVAGSSKSDPAKSETEEEGNKPNSGKPTTPSNSKDSPKTVDSGETTDASDSTQADADSSASTGNTTASTPPDTNAATPSVTGTTDAGSSSQQGDSSDSKPESETKSITAIPVSSVVDGPIDRLSLATSLFATKQLRECLKILEAVELRPLSVEDRQWHDYLAAGCYRDLGNRNEAESKYRSVLQRSSSTWISAAARWWLDHIDERADLQQKLKDVQTTIGNWRKEVDVLKSAN